MFIFFLDRVQGDQRVEFFPDNNENAAGSTYLASVLLCVHSDAVLLLRQLQSFGVGDSDFRRRNILCTLVQQEVIEEGTVCRSSRK